MAKLLISILVALNLFLISFTNGRVFHKNNSSAVSISDIKGKPVSLQAATQTNADDVKGLATLVTQFPTLKDGNPDPCLSPRWTWIECNSDARPRVIALNLSKRRLISSVPDFSSMAALRRIDLSQNYFSGNIPQFLGTFSNLQELNVADNLYSGYIPDSVACNKNLKLWVSGNAGLYVSSKCISTGNIVDATLTPTYTYTPTPYTYTYREPNNTIVRVRAILSILFVLIVIGIVICIICRCRANTAAAVAARNAGTHPNDPNTNMPVQVIMPVNSRPTNTNPVPK